jgi:hypothetical protein
MVDGMAVEMVVAGMVDGKAVEMVVAGMVDGKAVKMDVAGMVDGIAVEMGVAGLGSLPGRPALVSQTRPSFSVPVGTPPCIDMHSSLFTHCPKRATK